jgi:integrase
MNGTETEADCGSQNGKAKSGIVSQIARLVRKAGLDYEGWRYVAKQVRKTCDLKPAKKGKKLPRVLTADDFRKFYGVVDKADDVQHSLMLRLLFYTGVRVSELCGVLVADVDLDACKIRVNQGKGSKDRYVLFGKTFATALRTHIAAHPPTATCSRPAGTPSTPLVGFSRLSSTTPRLRASRPRPTPSGIRRLLG